MNFRTKLIATLILTATTQSFAAQNQNSNLVEIEGQIISADCGHLFVKPAKAADANKCVVTFRGKTVPKLADGTTSSTEYYGDMALMGQEMNPEAWTGKNINFVLDLSKGEIIVTARIDFNTK